MATIWQPQDQRHFICPRIWPSIILISHIVQCQYGVNYIMNLIYVIILWTYPAPVSSALTDIHPLAQRPSFPLPPYFLLHSSGLSFPLFCSQSPPILPSPFWFPIPLPGQSSTSAAYLSIIIDAASLRVGQEERRLIKGRIGEKEEI